MNIIVEFDIKIILKRYKISKKDVTKIIIIQINDFDFIDLKLYINLIHYIIKLKSLIFD